ncbi:MAG TPA: hypothetical protein VI704_03655 [Bacteroidota bacterium]|nr:hypothetical protein [Bacteroidota bacterium]
MQPEEIKSIKAPVLIILGDADIVPLNTPRRCSVYFRTPGWPFFR